jgi:competence protein ComEA
VATGLERFSHAIIIGLAALLVAAVIALVVERHGSAGTLEITLAGTPTAGGPSMAYITGAVAQPGLYEITDGERAGDLLSEAGGPAADADLEALNLAVRLHDQDRVIVPRTGEAATSSTSQVAGAVSAGAVNLNTASAKDLDALPGIGAVYSQRIVDSRTTNGPFATTDDLVNRQLIPRATYDKIRDMIIVAP